MDFYFAEMMVLRVLDAVGLGNGLMDEEFREWVQRIQSLQEETISPSTTSSQTDTDDDITQDLIAAFR